MIEKEKRDVLSRRKRMLLNMLVVLLVFAASWASIKRNSEREISPNITATEESSVSVGIDDLENTENFARGSLVHIFHGEINGSGQGTGYHSESMKDTPGEIIPGTEEKPDSQGVYIAQVQVHGVKKASNKGYSTFFPKDWTPQQVVDGINQAYASRQHDTGNIYFGETKDGILVQMYLDQKEQIISAFPTE